VNAPAPDAAGVEKAPAGWSRQELAKRVAEDLGFGWYVNIGIGKPVDVVGYVDPAKSITLHSENGLLGVGPRPPEGEEDWELVDAGKAPVTLLPGASVFDSSLSFGLVRGGHLDLALLGALQVSGEGDLANWNVPGKSIGVGGAMDLVRGARRVWIMMDHVGRDGSRKLVESCGFPLTGRRVVDRLYTNLGIFDFHDGVATLRECAPGISTEIVRNFTGAAFEVAPGRQG
jgi:3-oxoacid CoA-transferase B subunit